MINNIDNLKPLFELVSLNLSDNFISKIENLEHNINLETLVISRNKIGINGLSDVEDLIKIPKLSSLDISNNKIDCENYEDFLSILEKMPSLSVLYL